MSENGVAVLDREDLRRTVAQVLDIEPSALTDLKRFEEVGGDSLLALEVIVVLEVKYGVRFGEAEIRAFTSLSSIHDLLAVKLGAA